MQIKKKYIYIALGLWALVTVTYFTLCKIASDQAMLIFNKTMSAQKVLKGSVTLFLFDADYWWERIVVPGGLADYIAEYLTQFYSHVWAGACILAFLYVLLQRLVWSFVIGCHVGLYY